MSDRTNTITVTVALANNIRIDDIQPTLDAIRMIRGVIDVKANVADQCDWVAYTRARHELVEKLFKSLAD